MHPDGSVESDRRCGGNPLGADSCEIQLQDEDGDFLLIEAAQSLPDWMDPEVMKNRFFLWKGHFHVVSPQLVSYQPSVAQVVSLEPSFSRVFIPCRHQPVFLPPSNLPSESEWNVSGRPLRRTCVPVWSRGDGNGFSARTAGLPPIFAA